MAPGLATRLRNPKVAVSIVFVVGMFMNILDTTIVNVALPSIAKDFHSTAAQTAAVSVGYLVSLAIFIPASGWLGDRYGHKRIFMLALVLFTGASALCGLATSLPELVAFRVVQGAGGGMLMPVGMAMLMRTFPPAERIRASRILTVPTAFAPAVGPVLGGLLVTTLSWNWVFFINVPVGIAAVAFGFFFLREDREPSAGRFDLPGFLCAGLGLGAAMYALSEGSTQGWTSPQIVLSGVLGVVLLGSLVLVERRSDEPLLDLALFGNRLFRSSNLVIMFGAAGFLGAVFLLPILLQEARGLSALQSGLTTFPTAIGVMLASQPASRLYPVIGPRRMLVGGLVVVTAMLASLALIGPSTNLWLIRLAMLVLGAGMASVFIPSQTAAFATVPRERSGGASTLFNVQRQIGSAVGVAVLASVLAGIGAFTVTATGVLVPNYSAYRWGFAAAAFMALLGVVFALTIHDADAAPTMVGHHQGAERDAADRADDPRDEAVAAVALETGDLM